MSIKENVAAEVIHSQNLNGLAVSVLTWSMEADL